MHTGCNLEHHNSDAEFEVDGNNVVVVDPQSKLQTLLKTVEAQENVEALTFMATQAHKGTISLLFIIRGICNTLKFYPRYLIK